ncbi:PAS domain-containing protein [Sphingomonas sp. PAMC 26617]|uniref:PAS domain-containing protein n=1 Tax=Sphingomonas sp. PAMC 26617 TaxID=1112216 RepID=UPI000289D5D5
MMDDAKAERGRILAELAGLDDGTDPFAAAVRATRMPMVITDPRKPDNPIVFANKSFYRLTGYAHDEVLGHNCRFLQGPETEPATVELVCAAIAAREPIEIDIRNYTKDGHPFWNRLLIAPVFDTDGSIAYFFASQFDVTADYDNLADRVRELTEANERLRVEAAARKQIEEALRQSQKMEAVGQLTGGLAHDFNNLLTGITGSLDLIQTRLAQGRVADVDRYITGAQGAAKRAAALTHRLLAFSRRQTLDPKPTNANRLVTGMVELIQRTVGPEIAVKVVAPSGLWNSLIDPHQLENALLNLCINARDAMPDGGRITIETGNLDLNAQGARDRDLAPGQYVTLCVTDTGTGMSPEVIRRAFDPFYTTKPIGLGTGLGLSMIHGFVRQSGGLAHISSEPGHGTAVCLFLPRDFSEAGSGEEVGASVRPLSKAESATVLVVDDEPTVRMVVSDVLADLGYTAIEAEDGAAGLRVLQSDVRIDLLVTDVGLPGGLNGRQVADAGRALRPGLTVLFITGYADNAVLDASQLDSGMRVMTKPFTMDALAQRINDMVSESSSN